MIEESVVVQEFLNYLNFEKRFSEHTVKCYGADMSQFAQFLIDRTQADRDIEPLSMAQHHGGSSTALATQANIKLDQLLLTAQTDAVRAYLAVLSEKQYSKTTIARKLATLRSFYK